MHVILRLMLVLAGLVLAGCAQIAPGQCSLQITPEKRTIARDVIKEAWAHQSRAPFSRFERYVVSRYEDCGSNVRVFFDPREGLSLTDWESELFVIDVEDKKILRYKEDY